jgi:hypothetical protein
MPAPLREFQWSNASEPEWKLWQARWPKEGVTLSEALQMKPREDDALLRALRLEPLQLAKLPAALTEAFELDPPEDEKVYLIDLLQHPALGNMEALSYTDEFPALNGRRLLLIRREYRQLLGKVDNGLDTFRKTVLLTGQPGTDSHPPVVKLLSILTLC